MEDSSLTKTHRKTLTKTAPVLFKNAFAAVLYMLYMVMEGAAIDLCSWVYGDHEIPALVM